MIEKVRSDRRRSHREKLYLDAGKSVIQPRIECIVNPTPVRELIPSTVDDIVLRFRKSIAIASATDRVPVIRCLFQVSAWTDRSSDPIRYYQTLLFSLKEITRDYMYVEFYWTQSWSKFWFQSKFIWFCDHAIFWLKIVNWLQNNKLIVKLEK